MLFCVCFGAMKAAGENGRLTVKVDSTHLAALGNVMDIINQVSEIYYLRGEIYVIGRGVANVYVDERRLNDLTELWHIPAEKVDDIEIEKNPGARYDKGVRAVVTIHLKPVDDDGFTLDNNLSLDYNDLFSISDKLNAGWKRKKLETGIFVGWEQARENRGEDYYEVNYGDGKPLYATKDALSVYSHSQQLTLKGNMGYDITPMHHIGASYSFEWVPLSSDRTSQQQRSFYKAVNGVIDFDHPLTPTSEPGSYYNSPMSRHKVSIGYSGSAGRWGISGGTDLSFSRDESYSISDDDPDGASTEYSNENITRTYIKATLPMRDGRFETGIEFNTDFMSDNCFEAVPDPQTGKFEKTHADKADNTIACYLSFSRKLKKWNFSGGLRYEGNFFQYKPHDDDGVMLYLDSVMPYYIGKIDPDEYIFAQMWMKRKFANQNHRIYPNLSIETRLGKSNLTFSHTETYEKAYLSLMSITLADLGNEAFMAKILKDERIFTTSIEWKWKWLDMTLSHNLHKDPLFTSIDNFNGSDYNDITFEVCVCPTIGPWSPSLTANVYKQWLNLSCADPEKLGKPLVGISWTNNISLKGDWLLLVNADWRSRGTKADRYYHNPEFEMAMAVQKSFLQQHLSVKLQLDNIFRRAINDYTILANDTSLSTGYAIRLPRTLTLSVKYKF